MGETNVHEAISQIEGLLLALYRLPLATVLAAMLAFRPRLRGTPPRQSAVIQTQIILAIVGAVVMLVVGSNLARAFGIVGAAGLIRYRAKIEDPKDAGVMLSTLAIGLACGVGLWAVAIFSAAFIMVVLLVIESIEPEAKTKFELTIAAKEDVAALRPAVEKLLHRLRIAFELRTSSANELCFEVNLPQHRTTESLTTALTKLAPAKTIEVKWAKQKK
ncbi:MAG TPA: DUF4956 domain-containing protein [Vicinamibacterales bacterium]|jgi:uncharacterized membrane protein YhiD involved in acid resistance|nr:DUF4956 domain-containing protein [Vicinamibacterales bacterium]